MEQHEDRYITTYLFGSSQSSLCQFPVAVFGITADGNPLSNKKKTP